MELECKAQETAYNEKTDKADFSVAPKGNAEQERDFGCLLSIRIPVANQSDHS